MWQSCLCKYCFDYVSIILQCESCFVCACIVCVCVRGVFTPSLWRRRQCVIQTQLMDVRVVRWVSCSLWRRCSADEFGRSSLLTAPQLLYAPRFTLEPKSNSPGPEPAMTVEQNVLQQHSQKVTVLTVRTRRIGFGPVRLDSVRSVSYVGLFALAKFLRVSLIAAA